MSCASTSEEEVVVGVMFPMDMFPMDRRECMVFTRESPSAARARSAVMRLWSCSGCVANTQTHNINTPPQTHTHTHTHTTKHTCTNTRHSFKVVRYSACPTLSCYYHPYAIEFIYSDSIVSVIHLDNIETKKVREVQHAGLG